MAILKRIHQARGTASTSDNTTWTTVASYTLSTNATVVLIPWILGKNSSGQVASAAGFQSAERISGTITLIGSAISSSLDFTTGSNAALSTCSYRFNISANDIQLQVRGVSEVTIEWMGGFEIKIN